MPTDIEIAQAATLKPIADIASKLNLPQADLIPYGQHIAKLSPNCVKKLQKNPNGKLILVTAISPTPAGEGKTTTTIGLADALNKIGKNAVVCIREPSLGPVFGLKGGATGGGHAQVVPMENINLHFTGDFHAITSANNLLAAIIDNHIHQGNLLNIKHISWRRCMDMNDRALRNIHMNQAFEYDTGFDITVASEVMAIFCLAENLDDLKMRLGNIQVATDIAGKPVLASDLQAEGAMTALLKDAFQPNLVQTLEHTPAIIHGGPFANIAHGCNSVVATKTALKLADYVVTEAGFGADLGAEKFFDIKCRKANLQPDVVVIVATVRALKYHGGADLKDLNIENIDYLLNGISNLKKHINNLHELFGMHVVVAINHFNQDTSAEIAALQANVETLVGNQCKAIVCKHWAEGGAGALELGREVMRVLADEEFKFSSTFKLLYPDDLPLLQKIETIAQKVYGASSVQLSEQAAEKLKLLEKNYSHFPICIAKTQYSFSSDAALRGAPTGHTLLVNELRLSRGAGFIVA
ncbi:MAG TPA: formate--tetrahydrofolate ligase, partial [Methylotenera sp.]|nr:formate--tetrahydrofolate ligase [Methylotenera sp.]